MSDTSRAKAQSPAHHTRLKRCRRSLLVAPVGVRLLAALAGIVLLWLAVVWAVATP